MKKQAELIIEFNDGMYWGRIENKGTFSPNGAGETIEELKQNVKDSIEDYQANEGKADKYWSKIDVNELEFELLYDLQAFFEMFSAIKLNAIAEMAGINRSLLNQYSKGLKFPSAEQVKKIETAVHRFGKSLNEVNLVAVN